nr:uncharacterized protein LOC129045422 [Mirounga angustirostris]
MSQFLLINLFLSVHTQPHKGACACTHTCTHSHACTHAYSCTHKRTHSCTHTHTYACTTLARTHSCTHNTHMHSCTHVHTRPYTHTCPRACTHPTGLSLCRPLTHLAPFIFLLHYVLFPASFLSPSCPLTDDFLCTPGFHCGTRGASVPLTQAGTQATVCGVFALSSGGPSFASQPPTLVYTGGSGVSEQLTGGAWGPGAGCVLLPPPFTVGQSQSRAAPSAPQISGSRVRAGAEARVHTRDEQPGGDLTRPPGNMSVALQFASPPAPLCLPLASSSLFPQLQTRSTWCGSQWPHVALELLKCG